MGVTRGWAIDELASRHDPSPVAKVTPSSFPAFKNALKETYSSVLSPWHLKEAKALKISVWSIGQERA